MSHFPVIVFGDNVDVLLAPYDANNEWFRDGSKWDWWSVGGRWTGSLDEGYDPYKDSRNMHECWLCKGTGKRSDVVTFFNGGPLPSFATAQSKEFLSGLTGKPDKEAKPYTLDDAKKYLEETGCNGCGGTGQDLKHASDWQSSLNDVTTVAHVKTVDFTPFAIVLPRGTWLESVEMSWWGITNNELDAGQWTAMYKHELNKLPDETKATLVDCHV